MVLDQDKGVGDTPEKKFEYEYIVKEKQGDGGKPAEVVEIFAGYVLDGVGGSDFLYIAKAVRLPLQEGGEPVERYALELYIDPAHPYTHYTDSELARSAIDKSVPASDKRIDAFFNTAAKREKEPFNSADYLQKGTGTDTEEAKSINPEEEQ
ncbi:MAG: hypothetical protein U9Q92_06775 [archaeon]|nr:hypothetical protein [archaeon]